MKWLISLFLIFIVSGLWPGIASGLVMAGFVKAGLIALLGVGFIVALLYFHLYRNHKIIALTLAEEGLKHIKYMFITLSIAHAFAGILFLFKWWRNIGTLEMVLIHFTYAITYILVNFIMQRSFISLRRKCFFCFKF